MGKGAGTAARATALRPEALSGREDSFDLVARAALPAASNAFARSVRMAKTPLAILAPFPNSTRLKHRAR